VFVCIFLDIYFSNNLFLSSAIERDDRRRKGKLVSLLFLERERERSFGYDKFKLPPPSSLCLFYIWWEEVLVVWLVVVGGWCRFLPGCRSWSFASFSPHQLEKEFFLFLCRMCCPGKELFRLAPAPLERRRREIVIIW
jgi:hypothetical protein